jgi:adenosylhomocysteine nucleosidase
MRIGIIAALPGELKPLVRGWPKMPVARGSGIQMWQSVQAGDELVAVCAGMGAPAARRAFSAAEFAGSLDLVFSVGWAGALKPEAEPGAACVVSEIIDTQTGERFSSAPPGSGVRLVTTVMAAGEREKQRLAASYNASLVDMEAAAIARLARMRDIPMHCIKAVSDGLDANLPDLNPFIDVDGKLRMAAFLGYVALRPQYWAPIAALARTSSTAAHNLAKAIRPRLKMEGVKA